MMQRKIGSSEDVFGWSMLLLQSHNESIDYTQSGYHPVLGRYHSAQGKRKREILMFSIPRNVAELCVKSTAYSVEKRIPTSGCSLYITAHRSSNQM